MHLCFLGLGSGSGELLETLGDTPACFLASAEEIYENADLVRRILGSGSSVGLRVRASLAEEAGDFRAALRDTAMCASFLACAAGLEEDAGDLDGTGFRLLRGEAPCAAFTECAEVLASARGSCDLLLTGDFPDLGRLLRLLERDHYTLEAVNEVTAGR